MIYNEVNKFFSRPEAKQMDADNSSHFVSKLRRIATEPPKSVIAENEDNGDHNLSECLEASS